AGDDVLLAGLLGPPAKRRHPVLDSPRRKVLGKPALDQLLDVLGLQAVGVHMPEAHLVELVGDEIEDVFPIRLGGIATVAVVPAELLQVVVQIAHRYLLSFSSSRPAKIAVERFFLAALVYSCPVSVSARLGRQWQPQGVL